MVEIIREIDLSYNQIVHIPKNTFNKASKTLVKLNLEENEMHAPPSCLSKHTKGSATIMGFL